MKDSTVLLEKAASYRKRPGTLKVFEEDISWNPLSSEVSLYFECDSTLTDRVFLESEFGLFVTFRCQESDGFGSRK